MSQKQIDEGSRMRDGRAIEIGSRYKRRSKSGLSRSVRT